MNLRYLFPRFIRHFLPDRIVRFLLNQRLIIKPGIETSAPEEAVSRYLKALEDSNVSINGKNILILGYGGRFAVGCGLLDAGAQKITLTDPFAPPNHAANQALLPRYAAFLTKNDKEILPKPGRLELVQEDIRKNEVQTRITQADLIFSNSVFEHISDVEGTAKALSLLSHPDSKHYHFIDLQDHYFRYPFEMLTSQKNMAKSAQSNQQSQSIQGR